MSQLILILLALLAANLPWFSNKLFYCIPLKKQPKSLFWCIFELLVLYGLLGLVAFFAEQQTYGQRSPQDWEFYTVTFSLFLVFSFPGFVIKTLWK